MNITRQNMAIGAGASLGLAVALALIAVGMLTPTARTVHSSPVTTYSLTSPPTASAAPTPPPYTGPVAMTVAPTATMGWSSTLTPADFVNIFSLVDPAHGFYATGGAHFLITHSEARGFGAPGNAWEKLQVGQVVGYAGSLYRINLVSTPPQGDIASEPVWFNDPNMLVMITCLSKGAGQPATNNVVIRLEKI